LGVFEVSVELCALLFVVAVVAGFLDTLAGGGGLLTIPALLLGGLPPLAALATNKLQGCVGTATASFMVFKTKRVDRTHLKKRMLAAFIGSALGTVSLHFISADALAAVVPVVLGCIALYFLVSPLLVKGESTPHVSEHSYQRFVVPTIGFYDGVFGPGTGSFYALAGMTCRGLDLIRATVNAKPLNFATNFASLLVFLFSGHIVWLVGFVMMCGQALGAWMGARTLVSIPAVYVRILVVLMCLGMLIKSLGASA